jgi:hypothetical protein
MIFLNLYSTTPLLLLYFALQIITIYLLLAMPIYQYPCPTGYYFVGFIEESNISIYYPTDPGTLTNLK